MSSVAPGVKLRYGPRNFFQVRPPAQGAAAIQGSLLVKPHGEHTDFGFSTVKTRDKEKLVYDVFAKVSSRYDLMNDLMSGGLHRLWKNAMVSWLAPPRSERPWRHLDVAGGTGDIALRVAEASGSGAASTVIDINPHMLAEGRARVRAAGLGAKIGFAAGNAQSLPAADNTSDAYTIAFGIRNVTHLRGALEEAYRVLRPGGRFLCLEFSTVGTPGLDALYDAFSFSVIPALGKVVTGDGAPYRYLVESIRRFPDQESFAAMIRDAGFSRVDYRNHAGGVVAIHSGWKI